MAIIPSLLPNSCNLIASLFSLSPLSEKKSFLISKNESGGQKPTSVQNQAGLDVFDFFRPYTYKISMMVLIIFIIKE
jgi:hypothetical protein